ncbi:ATP-binding protein [Streptomyces spiramyceticus]|uniref:ATP-binding protein n=1 Tax=Streptomyces spiramyceticus TaxID=299717 RepID=UPI00237B0113|nr:ATP-binding protein [Streptomyces spiramyceticus]
MTTTATDKPQRDDQHRTQSYRLTTPNTLSAPKVAREMLAGVLFATGHPRLVDAARICVSDIVSNVVTHTTVPLMLIDVTVTHDRVLVGVRDNDPDGRPCPRTAHADEEGGRGLALVRELSDSFGVTWIGGAEPTAKRVWFELRE